MEIQSGVATASGDGVLKTFSFPHNCSSIPTAVTTDGITGSKAVFQGAGLMRLWDLSWDATNITINYIVAMPAGTDNLKWSWIAIVS